MDILNTVFQNIKDQLGIEPSLIIKAVNGGADIEIRLADEGGNVMKMSRFVYSEDLARHSVTAILLPLCEDVQALLNAVRKAKSEMFYDELMSGAIPSDLPVN